jgi:hypothetical protein
MAKREQAASERARQARVAAALCASAMLGLAAWLVWRHTLETVIALDAERALTFEAYILAHAVSLFAAAQPARAHSGPLNARMALKAAARASVSVIAAAFFVVDVALAWSVLTASEPPAWALLLLVPAGISLVLLVSNFGVPPEGPDEISDDDLTEAALILTESQRRWSWEAVYSMAGYMAFTRTAILAAYFVCIVAGIALFEWLSKALFDEEPLTASAGYAALVAAIEQARAILTQGWIWIVFVLVAVLPPLFILSAAVWYRFQVRRERARLRTLSQTPAARLLTRRELSLLLARERAQLRALVAAAKGQRAVS